MSSSPAGPYKLVTVNTAPDRAKRLIGRVVEDVKDKYTIIHAGNAACASSSYFHSHPFLGSFPKPNHPSLTHPLSP